MAPGGTGIALIAPRNMRFSPGSATSIDLYIHEIARMSGHRDRITVFAKRMAEPFDDVAVRLLDPEAGPDAWGAEVAATAPGLVVVHQHLPTAMRLAKRLPGVPVALVRHNFVKPPRNLLSAWRKRRQFERLAALAFVSGCCREAFRAEWPGVRLPLFVTPNGIDTAAWAPGPKRDTVAFVGRLAREKGVLEAAEALASVLPRHPGWDGVFVLDASDADPAYGRAVMAAIEGCGGRIRVLRNLPHAQVRRVVSEAAIALAPTQNAEPFGRVAVEALASGAALVATRAGGFVEIAGEAAMLLDRPSSGNLAHAVETLISDPALRARLAALGPERVAGRYDLGSAAAAFDAMADALIAGTAGLRTG